MPNFTTKHYRAVAESIAQSRQELQRIVVTEPHRAAMVQGANWGIAFLTGKLIEEFKRDNPRFKSQLFLEATLKQ